MIRIHGLRSNRADDTITVTKEFVYDKSRGFLKQAKKGINSKKFDPSTKLYEAVMKAASELEEAVKKLLEDCK